MDAELAGLRRRAAFRNTFEPDAGYLKACAYKKRSGRPGLGHPVDRRIPANTLSARQNRGRER